MTERLYRDDPYLLEFEARVLARRSFRDRPAVVLDRTAFYPEGGGQPWDTGTLAPHPDGAPVTVEAVLDSGGELLHVLASPLAAERVLGRVDAERRRDHREQHHGQHLLSRACVEVAGARTVSVHFGAEVSTLDLDRVASPAQLRAAERLANAIVSEARPVVARVVTRAVAEAAGVRAPEDAGDAVRLVEAEGFDLQACGGTHPRSTSEVGPILVLGHERYKGGVRVAFVCGGRALAAIGARNEVLERLCAILSAPVAELPDAARRLVERQDESARRERALLERALEAEARRLYAAHGGERPALILATYADWAPDELRTLAVRVVAQGPCVALLGSRAEQAYLVFAQAEGLPHDIPALLREAVQALGGRGGGRGNLAQGGGERTDRLDAVLARAAEAVRAGAGPR